MLEHTKGPWTNREGMIFGRSKGGCQMKESDFMVAQIRGWGHLQYLGEEKGIAVQEANARLIAAAPDLLEACKNLVSAIEAGNDYDTFLVAANTSGWAATHCNPAAIAAKTAIAKAEPAK